jgi:hypothetical protein
MRMRIDQITKSTKGNLARISARVTWEDCDRPTQEIYISVPSRFLDDLSCNPNTFLLNGFVPAMHDGEKRLQIEGKLCPQLHNGVKTAIQLLQHWYGEDSHSTVAIEAKQGFEPPVPRTPERTALFMSGGVDSLTNLYLNRQDFPLDHPGSIQDGLFIAGFGLVGEGKNAYTGPIRDAFKDSANVIEQDAAFLSELAEREKFTLIPIHTNFTSMVRPRILVREMSAAFLAAIAHVFPHRYSKVKIASDSNIAELYPWGTHPFLDPNYSSAEMSIYHEGCHLTRLEKVGTIADWELGLSCLRVCNYRPEYHKSGTLNCGRCDKCIRTMLQLIIHGGLDRCSTFPNKDVTPEMITHMKLISPPGFLPQLVEPLEQIGRHDLAQALKVKLKKIGWRNTASRIDQRYLGGNLRRLYRQFRGGVSS